jgi:hypothetical protein
MDQVYGSRDHGWLSVHGGLMTMRRHCRSGAREVVKVLTNDATGKRSCGDGHMTVLNRGGR